jgi:tRNA nucleotidyltransferase (CCA-adding enzyme)
MLVIDYAAERGVDLPVRFAALMHDLGKGAADPGNLGPRLIADLAKRLRVPVDCRDLAVMTAREQNNIGRALALGPNDIVTLFERCDAFRKPERFAQMLLAAECDARDRDYPQGPYLLQALAAARAVNAGEIAGRCGDDKARIPAAVHAARVAAVTTALQAARD